MVSAMLDASVIVCTHNPRPDYFVRVLEGLRYQTLPFHRWELLIVDNASLVPLALRWDISWHPSARHILESELGIASARRRGIQEASADLIIFVDDDNVLDKTYLAEGIKIGQEWPRLGAWGSGSILGELEADLPDSLKKYRSWLPLREVKAPRWSNVASYRKADASEDVIPMGAGLCVRTEIAVAYRQFCNQSSLQIVSRQGEGLQGGEDIELAFVCCSRGFGLGVFPELKMTYLIAKHRLTEDYFVRFAEAEYLTEFLLDYKWRRITPQSPLGIRTLLSVLRTIFLYRGVDRRLRLAWVRALIKARRIIEMELRMGKVQGNDPAEHELETPSPNGPFGMSI